MKEVKIGEKQVRVRGTALALLYYKQEFNADLVGDLSKMEGIEKDYSKFDTSIVLQMMWAMAKADVFGEKFPGFEQWLSELGPFDIQEVAAAVIEEAMDGFFRGRAGGK